MQSDELDGLGFGPCGNTTASAELGRRKVMPAGLLLGLIALFRLVRSLVEMEMIINGILVR